MFRKSILTSRIVLSLVCLSFVGLLYGQDTIPEPTRQQPVKLPTPPTDLTPESQSETAAPFPESNVENTSTNVNGFEEQLPTPIEKPKSDPELIAALQDNPFALIRDGRPKIGKVSMQGLPGYKLFAAADKNENLEKKGDAVEEPEAIEEALIEPVDTSTTALNALNPFRLEGSLADRKSVLVQKIKFNPQAGSGAVSTENNRFNAIFDASEVDVNSLGTLKFSIIILLLGLLTFIVTNFRNILIDVYRSFLSANLMSLLHRNKGTLLQFPYLSMFVLSAFSFGTFIFLVINLLGGKIFENDLWSISVSTLGVGSIFLLRHLSIGFLAAVFPFNKEIKLYGFLIAVFNFIIGIGLIPIVVFIAFAPPSYHKALLYSTLILLGMTYLFRTIRALIIGNKYLINNKFHFFMYLCTIELAPIFILLKLLGY